MATITNFLYFVVDCRFYKRFLLKDDDGGVNVGLISDNGWASAINIHELFPHLLFHRFVV